MSKTVTHYYRYQKIVSEKERYFPNFTKYLFEFEDHFKVPENTPPLSVWFRYEHEHETIKGALVINYFENEEDAILYEASYCYNKNIYKYWVKQKAEYETIREYKSKRN